MKFWIILRFLILYFILFLPQSKAQLSSIKNEKLPIDSTAIVNWPSLGGQQALSNNGNFFMFNVQNQPIGGQKLVIQSTQSSWKKELIGINNGFFSTDSRQFIFQSNDSLLFLLLGSDRIKRIVGVLSYKQYNSEKEGWLAYSLNNKNKTLVLLNLRTGEENHFSSVIDYLFAPEGHVLLLQTREKENSPLNLQWINLTNMSVHNIWSSKNLSEKQLSNYQFDGVGKQLVFMTCDTIIWYYKPSMTIAVPCLSNQTLGLAHSLLISTQSPFFINNDHYIFFQLKKAAKEDWRSTQEGVQVDVWSYRDSVLPFEQDSSPTEISYPAVILSGKNNITRLQLDDEMLIGYNGDFALILDKANIPIKCYWWPGYEQKSWWLISLKNAKRKRLASVYEWSNISFSPDGQYLVYYDHSKGHYYSYHLKNGYTQDISGNLPSILFNHPVEVYPFRNLPSGPQCIRGWIPDSKAVIISDDYDIWQLDLEGKRQPVNLTNGYGREHQIKFQLIGPRNGNKTYKEGITVLLSAFNTQNKQSGFYQLTIGKIRPPMLLTMDSCLTSAPLKAANANAWVIQKESATKAPNYYYTNDLKNYIPLTNLHPQKAYNWLTAELINWKQLDGTPGQGVLYKPENFNPQKKYPVIFYYYEQLSQDMYRFLQPKFSDAIIDIPWYVSRGYLVFTPDIYYGVASVTGKVNGDYVVNTVVSAAHHLSSLQYVDSTRLGIQGHSFGGGETLYLVTHSNIFAAACAGSSTVSNEITAYLGIVRVHGTPTAIKMLHSEVGHNKIGATLWQRPDLYIRASPVFRADKVSTPLLLMHNLGDPACDWNQSAEMFMALRRLGKEAWMLQYDNGTHTISLGKDAIDYTKRMQQFFDHYLKNQPAPKWMTQGIPRYLKGIEAGLDLDKDKQ